MTEYSYHIYSRDEVLFHNLSEEDFKLKWNMLTSLVGTGTALEQGADLSYEKVSSGIGGHRSYGYKEPAGDDSY